MAGSSPARALEDDSEIHGQILREKQGTNQEHYPIRHDNSPGQKQHQTSVWMSRNIPTLLHNAVPTSALLSGTSGTWFRLP